jgi:hypothetical protein
MQIQLGDTTVSSRSQASFLQGGIATRYLPFADVSPFLVRGAAPVRAAGTVDYTCSINPHIPACNPTRDCTLEPCTLTCDV